VGRNTPAVRKLLVALGLAGVITSACAGDQGTAPDPSVVSPTSSTTTTSPPTTVVTTTTTVAAALPDVSMRPLATETLLAMLADGGAVLTNEALVAATVLDPDDEAEDHRRFGRIVGVLGASWPTEPTAIVRIDLFTDAAGASGFLADRIGDLAKDIEGAAPIVGIEPFPVDGVGDEALGVVVTHPDTVETAVLFRLGRIVASTSLERTGDARVPTQYLAEEVADSVIATLTGAPDPGVDAVEEPPYTFETEQVVEVGGDRTTLFSSGTVSGDARECAITSGESTQTLRWADGVVWERSTDAVEFTRVGGPAVEQRALLAQCPSWALDAGATGLDSVIGPQPASYVVDGVPVLGHRGDATDLAVVLGADTAGVDVQVFNVWIAEGTRWVVELDLVVSGPARILEPLLVDPVDLDQQVIVTVRHRVRDLGTAPPVRPPS
jgi:hypothetical protein